jgi:hypothetical protein
VKKYSHIVKFISFIFPPFNAAPNSRSGADFGVRRAPIHYFPDAFIQLRRSPNKFMFFAFPFTMNYGIIRNYLPE